MKASSKVESRKKKVAKEPMKDKNPVNRVKNTKQAAKAKNYRLCDLALIGLFNSYYACYQIAVTFLVLMIDSGLSRPRIRNQYSLASSGEFGQDISNIRKMAIVALRQKVQELALEKTQGVRIIGILTVCSWWQPRLRACTTISSLL